MSQIAANPWFFTNADQAVATAITSIVNQGDSILITTTAAHGIVQDQKFSVQVGQQPSYSGMYRAISVPSTTTILAFNQNKNRGLANLGAVGSVFTLAYSGGMVRAEQIYWQASAVSQTLLLTDAFGNTIWNPTAQNTAGITPYAYGKVYWIGQGLVINTLPATGTVQITVN